MSPGTRSLQDRLDDVVAGAPGRLSVTVLGDDGWSYRHGADRPVSAASTIKVPILIAVLSLVERGGLDLAEPVLLPEPRERVGGAGPLSLLPSVTELSLLETLRLMIALSDNDATNAVIDRLDLLGSDTLADLLARVPTRHTHLRRRLMDFTAVTDGVDNQTCAADLTQMLAALREGRLLGAATSRTAIDVLRLQQRRDGLPAYLAAEVEVASKTGELPGVRAEMALLERGNRWVAVSVVADDLTHAGTDRGTSVLPVFAEIGRLSGERLRGFG